jgi:ribosome-binding factor A
MKNTGDGRRKIRVEREVQETISNFVIQQLKNDLPGLVTITRVQMPADFRAAQVFISYYSTIENDKTDAAEVLQSWARDIQDEIGHTLKMRYCPKLTFFNDETTEKILKIEKILSEIAADPAIAKSLEEEDMD